MADTMARSRGANGEVLREIERMEQSVGKRMYRGILKTVARVWNPKEIQDKAIQEKSPGAHASGANEDCDEPKLRETRRVWEPSLRFSDL